MSLSKEHVDALKTYLDKAVADVTTVLSTTAGWNNEESVEGISISKREVEGYSTYMWRGELSNIKATPDKFLKQIYRIIDEEGFISKLDPATL